MSGSSARPYYEICIRARDIPIQPGKPRGSITTAARRYFAHYALLLKRQCVDEYYGGIFNFCYNSALIL